MFDEFYLKSPKGIEVTVNRSGAEIVTGKVNSRYSDVVVRETASGTEIIVTKNGKRLVRLMITNARPGVGNLIS